MADNIDPDEFYRACNLPPDIPSIFTHYVDGFTPENTLAIYAGYCSGPDGQSILGVDYRIIASYVRKNYLPGMKLVFDNLCEAGIDIVLNQIHRVIESTGVPAEDTYYFVAALDAEYQYTNFLRRNEYKDRINVIAISAWERTHYHIAHTLSPVFPIKKKDKIFLSFNRITRMHRVALVCEFLKRDLIKDSYYSFFHDASHSGLSNEHAILNGLRYKVSGDYFNYIEEIYHKNLHLFPLKLNIEASFNKTFVDKDDRIYYENSQLSLVTETFFFKTTRDSKKKLHDEHALFFSEKIFKPIAMKHPFIVAGRPGSLLHLRKLGYKTFAPFIDETYDDYENDEQRLKAIVREVERLSKFTDEEWHTWQQSVAEIVEHNHRLFSSKQMKDYIIMNSKYKINVDIPGWNREEALEAIAEYASRVPENGQILEIGALFGRTTYAIGHNMPPSAHLTTIDCWEDLLHSRHQETWYHDRMCGDNHNKLLENSVKTGPDGEGIMRDDFYRLWQHFTNGVPNLTGIRGYSDMDNSHMPVYDLIVHDAAHDYDRVYADLIHWFPKLKADGVFLVDDYDSVNFPGLIRAVDQFVAENNLDTLMITPRNILLKRKV